MWNFNDDILGSKAEYTALIQFLLQGVVLIVCTIMYVCTGIHF